MTTSVFTKTQESIRNVGNKTGSATGEVRIPLNHDHLTAEHVLVIEAAQSFAGAPTSSEVGMFIDTIALETDCGARIHLDGMSLVELSKFTENQATPAVVLGTSSTARFAVDLHHENDNAVRDLLTALKTREFSQLDLVINFAPDATNGFIGGTTPGVASYVATVYAKTFDDLTEAAGIDVDGNEYAQVGLSQHIATGQLINGSTTGEQQPIRLSPKNMTRFIQLLSLANASGVLTRSDDIIDNVRLVVNGREVRNQKFKHIQMDNEAKRNVVRLNSGVAALDFGDDEVGFLNLMDVQEALLYYSIDSSVSGSWQLRIAQDYSVDNVPC